MSRILQGSDTPFAETDKIKWVGYSLLLLAFVFCYKNLFSTLIHNWSSNGAYSHGFLVPFISLYIIWVDKDSLKSIQVCPSFILGLPLLLVGVALLLSGYVGGIYVFEEASLIIVIAGIVALQFGTGFLYALLFPITYLVFMLTSWGIITERLHYPFQLFSANYGAKLLNLIGIPAYRESVYIELPNITLKVARECSGVNTLISVIAIGVPLAYFLINSWPRRVVLMVFAIVIAMVANWLRISLIGTLAYFEIAGDLHGPYHILQGMITAGAGIVALFIGAWALSDKNIKGESQIASGDKAVLQMAPVNVSNKGAIFSTIIILFMAGAFIQNYTPTHIPLNKSFTQFPNKIGIWKKTDNKLHEGAFRIRNPDDELAMVYESQAGVKIELYVGYYAYQEQGKELITDRSFLLHKNSSRISIESVTGEAINANLSNVLDKDKKRRLIFWYELNGQSFTNAYLAKAYTTWGALIGHGTNGAIIMVYSNADSNQNEIESFISELIPALNSSLPHV